MPKYTIDDVVRYCEQYRKRTGDYLSYGRAVAMIEREERLAAMERKKKAQAKKHRKKGDGHDANGRG